MRFPITLLCAAALCAVGLSAQSTKRTTTSKITVKDGKDVTVTGCVERSGTGFILTKVADKRGALPNYMLVADDDEHLASHVGHLVQIKGKATDRGDAKIKIETRTETKGEHGDHDKHAETEVKGDLPNQFYLGVKSVKLVAAVCP